MGASLSKKASKAATAADAHLDNSAALQTSLPAPDGYFGDDKKYGGAYLPPPLEPVMKAVGEEYEKIKIDPEFLSELTRLRKEFIGRPSPIFHCKNLSDKIGGAQIYLKPRSIVDVALARSSPPSHLSLSPPACAGLVSLRAASAQQHRSEAPQHDRGQDESALLPAQRRQIRRLSTAQA